MHLQIQITVASHLKVSNSIAKTLRNGCSMDPEVGNIWAWPRMTAIQVLYFCSMYFMEKVNGHYVWMKCKLVNMQDSSCRKFLVMKDLAVTQKQIARAQFVMRNSSAIRHFSSYIWLSAHKRQLLIQNAWHYTPKLFYNLFLEAFKFVSFNPKKVCLSFQIHYCLK